MTARATAREEPFVGKELSRRTWTVDEAKLDAHYNGVDLPRPPADSGLPLVPSMLASEPDGIYFNEIAFSNQVGHLWMRQQWEFNQPLHVDATYESSGSIVDIYPKKRLFSDCTRTFCVGEPSTALRDGHAAVLEALHKAHAAAVPGVRGWTLQEI